MSNIGMMEGAYFVGRVELLNWLNDLLKLDYTKVEQACSAAAYCQIMDAIYPGQVPLSKVNFNAQHEYEYVKNYKVLQNVFDKLAIDKHIDVNKLVKGKYQDNLEFLQWSKRYFDLNYGGGEYNAIERRKGAYASDKKAGASVSVSKPAPTAASTAPKRVPVAEAKPKVTATATRVTTSTAAKTTPTSTATKPRVSPAVSKPAAASPSASNAESEQKVNELTESVAELKLTVDGLEKERDFYFGKLREIEIMCQQHPDQNLDIIQSILKVMYSTDESEGFVSEEAAPQTAEDDDETF